MKRFSFLFGILASVAISAGAAAATPTPKILVIDRTMILRNSKVGQDIVRQVNAYTDQAERDLKGQGAALRAEGEKLKTQLAILSADVKARRIKDFETKQGGLQQLAQKKQSLIQGGFIKARQDVERALGPVLQGIMVERGANLLLDRNSVVMGTDPALDVTGLAVQRLDQKLPTIKVELVAPPPGLQQAGAPPQQ
ncbi:MAG TPA: OmpH family outer membrane protein [Rhizomicrobium sp.]|nr:OmpH family outer membrane protein [Rhizomicrobium sp.]